MPASRACVPWPGSTAPRRCGAAGRTDRGIWTGAFRSSSRASAPGSWARIPGVTPYRIDIQQGNVVVQENLAKVKPGMSRNEVKQILGTPLLADPFHANRWDYYFSNAKRGQEVEKNPASILFENDKVARIEGTAPVAIKGEERSR